MTRPSIPDRYGNLWQYHSRSDRHSKVACWAVMFDLLANSATLRRHVDDGKVVFGVNHEMSDFHTRRKKNLDLVIARPGTTDPTRRARTFTDLAAQFGVRLRPDLQSELALLPVLHEGPVGTVLMALEAKACMTAHSKARPRLYDELTSSHSTVHGAAEGAIAAGLVMVNAAETFVSPDLNKFDLSVTAPKVNVHRQPGAAQGVIDKVEELRTRTRPGSEGFDAVGIVVVDCANDGRPVVLLDRPPALPPTDDFSYDQMIRRITHEYDTRYQGI